MQISRSLLAAALLLACVFTAPLHAQTAAPASVDLAAIPARVAAPNDLSAYRRFVLPNRMPVLLLSDPKLNVASASVAVGVGSLADPATRPGLAHYLEHMLFLGTQKYPSVEEFGEYLQRNGGYNNAYTARDRTNYHLQIPPAAFEGALDRFAQFFIAPLFKPEFNEREVNAVNSEYQKNLENDGWREFALRNSVLRDGHPMRGFHIGDRKTLAGTTQEELLAFHRRYYSANRMTLALTGPQSLDQLEQWARTYFAPVPDTDRPELVWPADVLPPKPALRLLRMAPVTDLRRLTLSFPLPDLRADFGSKPAAQVGYVLGNEGPGSLLAQLKAEGLATGLSAGADAETHQFGFFEIGVSLTPQGLQNYPRVLALAFAAIDQLRASGMPPTLFAERRTMATLDERFRDQGEGAERAVALANAVMDYPLAIAERVPYLWLQPDPAAVQRVLGRLRPDNLLVTLVAKGLPTDSVEKWFGAHYSYAEQTGPAYAALLAPPAVATITLPPPNPYVPAHTSLLPLTPTRLIDEPALSLYHAQDTEFQRPLLAQVMRFVLPRERGTLRTAALLPLYQACVQEGLTETTYAAAEAGLHFGFSAGLEGVQISIDGYDASAGRLLQQVAAGLGDCSVSPERFAALKDRVLRGLSAFEHVDAYQTLTESRRRAVREFYFRPDEILPLARDLSLADVRAFARGLYARGKLEALSYGNLDAAQARTAARGLAAALGTQPLPEAQLLRRRLLASAPGDALRASETLAVNNSAYRHEVMLGRDTPELRAATLALAAFIGPPTYSELRTQQQLGYIVFGGAGEEVHDEFAYFIIQSGDYPADVVAQRTEAFIQTLPALLRALPEAGWQTIVAGVRAKLDEKDKSVAERAGRLFELAYARDAEWARDAATRAALAVLTQQRAAEILAAALAPGQARTRTFLGFARNHEPKAPPVVSYTDVGAWKARQRYVP
jgi:insulysin